MDYLFSKDNQVYTFWECFSFAAFCVKPNLFLFLVGLRPIVPLPREPGHDPPAGALLDQLLPQHLPHRRPGE